MMGELSADTRHAFPGHGQPEQQEIDRLRREVAKRDLNRLPQVLIERPFVTQQ